MLDFFEGNEEKIREIEKLSDDLRLQQEKQFQDNLKEIQLEANLDTIRIESIESYKDAQLEAEKQVQDAAKKTAEQELLRAKVQEQNNERALEQAKKLKEQQQEVIEQIGQTAERIVTGKLFFGF